MLDSLGARGVAPATFATSAGHKMSALEDVQLGRGCPRPGTLSVQSAGRSIRMAPAGLDRAAATPYFEFGDFAAGPLLLPGIPWIFEASCPAEPVC
jgi:hypothetical protein